MGKTVGVVLSLKDKFSTPLKNMAEKLGTSEKALKKANLEITRFQNNAVKSFKKTSAVIAGAGAALIGFGVVATKTTMDYAKEVKTMQRLTGASVEDASKMVAVGKQYGVSADMMAKSIRMLAIKAANGGKDFKKYGLSVKDVNGQLLPATKILENVADKYKQLGGGLNGAVFAQKVMGKGAMSLIPLLAKGSKGVQEMYEQAQKMGLVLTNDNMAAFAKFNQVQKIFNQSMLGIQVTIGTKVLPYLSQLAEKAQVVIKKIDFQKVGAITTKVLSTLANATIFVTKNLNWLIPVMGALYTTFTAFKIINAVSTAMESFAVVSAAVKTMGGLQNVVMERSIVLQNLMAIKTGIVTAAQWLWNASILGCPLLLGIAVFAGFIAGLVYIEKKFHILTKAANALKKVWNSIGDHKSTDVKTPPAKKIPHHALGTNYFQGGLTHINERGGEIVNLPSGSQIIPHDLSNKMVNNGGKGDITVIIQGDFIGTREMLNKLKTLLANEFRTKVPVT